MTEVILLLYMREESYGRRMLRYLTGRKNPRLHPELVTDGDMILRRAGTETQRIVVLTDREGIAEDGKRTVITLTNTPKRGRGIIFQYQKADAIYEELVRQLEIKEESSLPAPDRMAGGRRILFLLSADLMGVTATAVMVSQYLGRQCSCLYLNLTGFPVWWGETLCEEPDFDVPGIDELLFMSNRADFAAREREIRKEMGQAWLIPPFRHYKDLLDSTGEDWKELFRRLQEDCGYDSIVVEIGPMMEHTTDLLELGDEALFLVQKGLLGTIRRNVWKQYCRLGGEEKLLGQTKWAALPEEWREWEKMMIEQPLKDLAADNQLMERIRLLLEEEEDEEENGYEWEGFG